MSEPGDVLSPLPNPPKSTTDEPVKPKPQVKPLTAPLTAQSLHDINRNIEMEQGKLLRWRFANAQLRHSFKMMEEEFKVRFCSL